MEAVSGLSDDVLIHAYGLSCRFQHFTFFLLITGFELSAEDLAAIAALSKAHVRYCIPMVEVR
jgi:hypothetical protein